MNLELRQGLVVLAGPSGVGKSTWAKQKFKDTEIVSSDHMRKLITDDENSLTVNSEAFELVNKLTSMRLEQNRPTVIDSTALLAKDRKNLIELARRHKSFCTLIVFLGDETLCMRGQKNRERQVPEKVVVKHVARLQNMISLGSKGLIKEGFDQVIFLDREQADQIDQIDWVTNTAKEVDIIGDIHGCVVELQMLLDELGYYINQQGVWEHPEGRVAAFVGDFTDRGPASLAVLRLVHGMQQHGSGMVAAIGNHDWKLYRYVVLERDVKPSGGMETTLKEIESEIRAKTTTRKEIVQIMRDLFANAPNCSVFDNNKLIITHGAVKKGNEALPVDRKRHSGHASLCLFGETSGKTTAEGFPERTYEWVKDWQGSDQTVVFGHDVIEEVTWLNDNVVSIDTGCVFGGSLTALKWPSKEVVQVKALRAYSKHHRI